MSKFGRGLSSILFYSGVRSLLRSSSYSLSSICLGFHVGIGLVVWYFYFPPWLWLERRKLDDGRSDYSFVFPETSMCVDVASSVFTSEGILLILRTYHESLLLTSFFSVPHKSNITYYFWYLYTNMFKFLGRIVRWMGTQWQAAKAADRLIYYGGLILSFSMLLSSLSAY